MVRVTLENQTITKVVQTMVESREQLRSRHPQPRILLSPNQLLLLPLLLHPRTRILNLVVPISRRCPKIGTSSSRRHRQIRSHKFSPQMDSSSRYSSSSSSSSSWTLLSRILESPVKTVPQMVLLPTLVLPKQVLNPSSLSSR